MIKRLIFDVDGTLIKGVDFTPVQKDVLSKYNMYSEENVKKYFQFITTYEKYYDSYNYKDYMAHFNNIFGTNFDESFLQYFFERLVYAVPERDEELISALNELSKDYEMVLLTNYFGKSQLSRLHQIGIDKFFTECYGEEKIKPNKEAYIKACCNNKLNECVMIGDDMKLDIEGALSNGLNAIYVNETYDKDDICHVSDVKEITKKLINEKF